MSYLLVGEGVPGRVGGAGSTRSFVLPFKIADSTSLGDYKSLLKDANPDFVPPYKHNFLCDDDIARKFSYNEELVHKANDLRRVDSRKLGVPLK